MERIDTLAKIAALSTGEGRKLFSATHEEILSGATTDIYFVKTQEILQHKKKADTIVMAELFSRQNGIFCGSAELKAFLSDLPLEVWALAEGAEMHPKEVVVRIKGRYSDFGLLETPMLGILASSSGWATAAYEMKKAAGDKRISVFGARHVHPAVAPVMERAALVGGVDSASCILGAKLYGQAPAGTAPHALFLIMGSTLSGALAYDEVMPPDDARLILIDTFKDEVEEALLVGDAMRERLQGIRLDTPSERGGVTCGLVQEMRARLDLAGLSHVRIFASGGLTPERVIELSAAGVDAFGVGSYISGASPIDMTMDLKEVAGKPVAKRGRIPGIIANPRLKRIL